jgi:hypothetical protein
MGNAVTVVPGAGFTGATATLSNAASDAAGIVTFTTSATIPASPYLIFTLTWGGSWASSNAEEVPAIVAGACANPTKGRTAAQMAAAAALGPFYVIPNAANTKADVYCTNAPAAGTAYDIAYSAVQGP